MRPISLTVEGLTNRLRIADNIEISSIAPNKPYYQKQLNIFQERADSLVK
jgi:hypothetical protein